MKSLALLGGICALLFVAALAPARSPLAPGDTLLHINVQGRGEIVIKLFTKEAPRATATIVGRPARDREWPRRWPCQES